MLARMAIRRSGVVLVVIALSFGWACDRGEPVRIPLAQSPDASSIEGHGGIALKPIDDRPVILGQPQGQGIASAPPAMAEPPPVRGGSPTEPSRDFKRSIEHPHLPK